MWVWTAWTNGSDIDRGCDDVVVPVIGVDVASAFKASCFEDSDVAVGSIGDIFSRVTTEIVSGTSNVFVTVVYLWS